MRIGLNLLYLLPGVVGGTETYARCLIRALSRVCQDHEFLVYVNREGACWPLPDAPNLQRIVCPVTAQSRWRRYQYENFRFPSLLRETHVDVVHSLGYVAPLFSPVPSVVTIHDLVHYGDISRMLPLSKRIVMRRFVRWSARRSERVIAVSDFGRDQICGRFGLSPDRVTTVYEAGELREAPDVDSGTQIEHGLGIRRPYIVAFGNTLPHKNIPRLMRAYARAKRQLNIPHQLVLIGHRPAGDSWNDLAGELRIQDDVMFTGYLEDQSMRAVLAGGDMLAFPSLHEGFGLPVLEAMSLGVPVVCSTAGSLPEVGGDAAVYFDPLSVDEMSDALASVAKSASLRADLSNRGLLNVRRFSWEKAALETLKIYEEVMQGRVQAVHSRCAA